MDPPVQVGAADGPVKRLNSDEPRIGGEKRTKYLDCSHSILAPHIA
jgi:hypothetical protein